MDVTFYASQLLVTYDIAGFATSISKGLAFMLIIMFTNCQLSRENPNEINY
ncbi:hypothetical protein GCM10009092_07950 [Bowmanella denitrificans]|uniref:Uncharacterized protein n=1 Tax=Bowmanella denitrificans TaxID=366582 RepID=A0ABN0WSX0_9ALTE